MISLALLIGGRGRRLGGVDKASISLGDTTTAHALLFLYGPRVANIFAVGRRDQGNHPLAQMVPVVVDAAADQGPLRGIATALTHATEGWVFVVACDVVDVGVKELAVLAAARTRSRLAVAWRSPNGVEPLCALYHHSLAGAATRLLDKGERRASAMLSGAHLIDRPTSIANINTPDELDQRRAALLSATP